MTQKQYKIPAILYESDQDGTSPIPYVEIQTEEEMPRMLFIQEYKHTGEFSPGPEGEEMPIVDITLHGYVDLDFLSRSLSPALYDDVRVAIGLQPVAEAREAGQKILSKFDREKANEEIADTFFDSANAHPSPPPGKISLSFDVISPEKEEKPS
jgi:hypothetical protein